MRASATSGDDLLAEINTTPLIDVMLVLLVVFMLFAPVAAHRVQATMHQGDVFGHGYIPPPVLNVRVLADGSVTLNGEKTTQVDRIIRLQTIGRKAEREQDVVRWSADNAARYESVAQVLAEMQRANVLKIAHSGLDPYEADWLDP
jgi:biopolymer transport protein ExbD